MRLLSEAATGMATGEAMAAETRTAMIEKCIVLVAGMVSREQMLVRSTFELTNVGVGPSNSACAEADALYASNCGRLLRREIVAVSHPSKRIL
jgi:hypothetical protein